jgi:hypothetical protein
MPLISIKARIAAPISTIHFTVTITAAEDRTGQVVRSKADGAYWLVRESSEGRHVLASPEGDVKEASESEFCDALPAGWTRVG